MKGSVFAGTDRKHVILFTKSNQCFSPLSESSCCTWVNSQHPVVLQCFLKGSSGGFCYAGGCSPQIPWSLLPQDAETELAEHAPGREKIAVNPTYNWMKQLTSTKSCQGYYWLAILLFRVNKWVRESEDRGSHRSQKRMARRQHKYAARSWVHPCKTIFPDTGLNLYFRSSQKPMFASAGMSFEYYKSISLGNYICPGWFYLASAPSHHILLFRNCTAQNAKGDPADVLLDVLWSRERCTRLRGFLPALHSPTTWAGLYQDIQSQF